MYSWNPRGKFPTISGISRNRLREMQYARTYQKEIEAVSGFEKRKHAAHTKRESSNVKLLCNEGDAEQGLEGMPFMWYFCNEWVLFKAQRISKDSKPNFT